MDHYTPLEMKVGLHHIKIKDYAMLLKEAAGDREVTMSELGHGFADQLFGKGLLKEEKNHPA